MECGEHVTSRQLSLEKLAASQKSGTNQNCSHLALSLPTGRFDPKVRLNGGTIWSLESR